MRVSEFKHLTGMPERDIAVAHRQPRFASDGTHRMAELTLNPLQSLTIWITRLPQTCLASRISFPVFLIFSLTSSKVGPPAAGLTTTACEGRSTLYESRLAVFERTRSMAPEHPPQVILTLNWYVWAGEQLSGEWGVRSVSDREACGGGPRFLALTLIV